MAAVVRHRKLTPEIRALIKEWRKQGLMPFFDQHGNLSAVPRQVGSKPGRSTKRGCTRRCSGRG